MAEELRDIEPLGSLLGCQPLGIVSDIDGTLAPIVDDPDAAAISPHCRALLQALMAAGVRVALVSGRSLEKARAMAGLPGAVLAANHGLDIWVDGQVETPGDVREYVQRAKTVLQELGRLNVPGMTVEDKGPVLAFHYRRSKAEADARQAILEALRASPSALAFRIQEGRKVIELRPPLAIDKGTALALLVSRMGARGVLCLGDDTTDVDMFRGVAQLRRGGMPAVNVAVHSPEISPLVLETADYWVRGVAGVEWLLAEIITALP
jgi:trehalose 6-phosphate phosphatase